MKNEQIKDLSEEVDVEIRIQVYKDTIAFIESKYEVVEEGSCDVPEYDDGLCMLLPAILWGLEKYSNRTPSGERWLFYAAGIAFPELTRNVINTIVATSYKEKVAFRKRVLKGFINKLK